MRDQQGDDKMGRACGKREISAEDRGIQEMSREHIFELGGREGSTCVPVCVCVCHTCVCVVWENNKEELRWECSDGWQGRHDGRVRKEHCSGLDL